MTDLAWMNRLLPDADTADRLRRFYMHPETFSLLQVSAVASTDGNTVGVNCSVTFASEIVPDWFRVIADEAFSESKGGIMQTAGIGGAIGGGFLAGAGAGATLGAFGANPFTVGLGTVAGDVVGAYYGEEWVQENVDSWLNGAAPLECRQLCIDQFELQ